MKVEANTFRKHSHKTWNFVEFLRTSCFTSASSRGFEPHRPPNDSTLASKIAKDASAGGTLPCAIVWRARRKLLDLTKHWISAANAAVAKARRSLPSEPLSKMHHRRWPQQHRLPAERRAPKTMKLEADSSPLIWSKTLGTGRADSVILKLDPRS